MHLIRHTSSLAAHGTQSRFQDTGTYIQSHARRSASVCELVRPYQLARALRSASSNNLEVKRTRTKAGGGSFAVVAASLWNTLPNFIKTCDTLASFKCRLKTHFFHISYWRIYCRRTLSSTHSNLIMTIPVILFMIFSIILPIHFYHLNYYYKNILLNYLLLLIIHLFISIIVIIYNYCAILFIYFFITSS